MLSVSSKIWTRVAVSIFYDDNHYTTSTSTNTTSIIRYGSRVSAAIMGMVLRFPLNFGVVAFEKGTFGLPSTNVG